MRTVRFLFAWKHIHLKLYAKIEHCMLKSRMCQCKVFSITTEKRKRFCTHAKIDENAYCVFPS